MAGAEPFLAVQGAGLQAHNLQDQVGQLLLAALQPKQPLTPKASQVARLCSPAVCQEHAPEAPFLATPSQGIHYTRETLSQARGGGWRLGWGGLRVISLTCTLHEEEGSDGDNMQQQEEGGPLGDGA